MTQRNSASSQAVGGEDTFRRLVQPLLRSKSRDDPLLRPVYPGENLGPAEEHLRLFLIQYWGGPRTYSEQRGHPRLRMRHAPFRIGEAERDAWLRHMRTALDELRLDPQLDAQLWDYLVLAAYSLVNSPGRADGCREDAPAGPAVGGRRRGAAREPSEPDPNGCRLAPRAAQRDAAARQRLDHAPADQPLQVNVC